MTERPLFAVDPGETDTATKLDKETNVDKWIKSRKIAKSKTYSDDPNTLPVSYDSTLIRPQSGTINDLVFNKLWLPSSGPPLNLRHCYQKSELSLSGKRLDALSLSSVICSHGNGLKKLDLSGCDLSYVDLRCLERLSGLGELNLSNNPLWHLHLKSLEHMPHSLKKLDVSGCDLSYVDWRCLKCLSGLEELNLSNNPLRHLNLEFLEHMQHTLKKLDVSGCDLPYVDWRCLKRLSGLVEELNLSNNPLRHLDLEFLERLKKLDLSGCGVTGQHLADQKYLRGLEDLNLSNNPLHSIKLFSSKSMPGLRTLDISGCGLTDKDLKDFALWDGVEELNLSNNPLSHMLRHRKNLKKLNLSGCCLTTWPSGLEECSSLEQLDLSNNSFGHQDLLENLPPSVSGLSNLNRIMFEDAIYTKNDKG